MQRKWKPKNILDFYSCDTQGVMHKSHSCSFLVYHFAFIPKYRQKLFTDPDLIRELSEYIEEVCSSRKWPIHKLGFGVDHIHLEIQLPPITSPTKAIQIIKGSTSRSIRLNHPEFRWSKGYWVGTVGKANKEIIDRYIEKQRVCII